MNNVIVVDTETTGLSASTDRVIEVAVVNLQGNVIFHSLIDPGIPIPKEITGITGITDEHVKGMPSFESVASNIADIIEAADVFIGHNPSFDRAMLIAEFMRARVAVKFPTLLCTKRIWDKYEPKEKRNLMNTYKRFVSRDGFDGAHGALADAQACARVYVRQREEFDFGSMRADEILEPEQIMVGGSYHITVNADDVLVMNIGKWKGKALHEIEHGYLRWMSSKDFPAPMHALIDYILMRPSVTAQELYSFAYGQGWL